jgi:hypothetical protein
MLVVAGCHLLEAELVRTLVVPAQAVGPVLTAAVRAAGAEGRQADVLDQWCQGRVPVTLGVASLVLLAVRRALEQRLAVVEGFLRRHFREDFVGALRHKEMGRQVDEVRNGYRNPACHGLRTFGPKAYEDCAWLVVARSRFWEWDLHGAANRREVEELPDVDTETMSPSEPEDYVNSLFYPCRGALATLLASLC